MKTFTLVSNPQVTKLHTWGTLFVLGITQPTYVRHLHPTSKRTSHAAAREKQLITITSHSLKRALISSCPQVALIL